LDGATTRFASRTRDGLSGVVFGLLKAGACVWRRERTPSSAQQVARAGTREILKSGGLLRQGRRDPMTAFRFIAAEKAGYSVKTMCRVLGVSRSGFHAWTRRRRRRERWRAARLTERIREIHSERRRVYGSPWIHADITYLRTWEGWLYADPRPG
jgi:hypothetical protein